MVFTSCSFVFLFFPVTILLYFLINPLLKNTFLFLASLFFYSWGQPQYLPVLLIVILINYLFGLIIGQPDIETAEIAEIEGKSETEILNGKKLKKDRKKDRKLRSFFLFLAVAFNLIILGTFKYLDFIINNINHIFKRELFINPGIVLPIGISFYIFQGLSYVIDVYRGDVKAEKNPVSLGLYISMFPQLIAGPIVRFKDIQGEIIKRRESLSELHYGICRFIRGFSKKILLADTLGLTADQIFKMNPSGLLPSIAWLGIISYTFQIYLDFSGYSDMAIGIGRMLGFHFSENFDAPYTSKSITEFWRRWHISLSSWFRDYLYIPLGGNRRGNVYVNLFIVFILTGLWHGASWKFIFWGLWHGFFILLERLLKRLFKGLSLKRAFPKIRETREITKITEETEITDTGDLKNRRFKKSLMWIYTLFVVMTGWVFFRADSLSLAFQYISAMFGIIEKGFVPFKTGYFLGRRTLSALIISAFLSFDTKDRIKKTSFLNDIFHLILFALSLIFLVSGSYNAFIYFQF